MDNLEELKQNTQEELITKILDLQTKEQRYRTLLDESSDPIFSFNPDGKYLYVNRVFPKIFGKTQNDIIGKTMWDIFPKEEADKRFAIAKWVCENKRSKDIEVCIPTDEGERYLLTTAKPVFDENNNVTSIICISKNITELKLMEKQLKHIAHHDILTNIPNRVLFNELLDHAIASAKRNKNNFALMIIDFDEFKPVNDSYGHFAGDLLLKEAAKRMKNCIRETDTIGRIGGDEFVVLLPTISKKNDAMHIAEKIRKVLNEPFNLENYPTIKISSSIGIAIYPEDGTNKIDLAKNADTAMYASKEKGKNRVVFFS